MNPLKPTRTEQTERRYLRRAQLLMLQAIREGAGQKPVSAGSSDQNGSAPLALHPVDFVNWVISHTRSLSKRTWFQYKSASVYYLNQYAAAEADYAEAIALLKQTPPPDTKHSTGATSSRKPKQIPEKDLVKLLDALYKSRSEWASRAALLVESSIIAGLRPIEWKQCLIADSHLVVTNAKATNNRGNGEIRKIPLASREIPVIEDNLREIESWLKSNPDKDYETYYETSRRTLNRAVRRLWKDKSRHYCLYSSRHQFSANMKAMMLSKQEIAELMGHSSEETAGTHYGRRISGWKRYKNLVQPEKKARPSSRVRKK